MASREERFAALTGEYARLVASAIRRVCSQRHRWLIPDVEQEVRLALWKRLEGGKEIEHPASYLYKAALTTALAVVRKQGHETMPIEDSEPSDTSGPQDNLLPAERARLLGEALERLPLDQSRAVRAHLAGFSHVEVAGLFGWTESVARHRIYRGIESLKEKMKGSGHATPTAERA